MVTIKDIARKLHVDHSTVGYALSGKGTIKEETRKLVVDTARKMGYVPNINAQRIRQKQTRLIGVIFPNIVMGYNEVIQHMFSLASERNYDLIVDITEFDAERENRGVLSMLQSRVDGIILKSCFHDWRDVSEIFAHRLVAKQKIPLVLYNTRLSSCPRSFSKFSLSSGKDAEITLGHLAERGHKNVVMLNPFPVIEENTARIYKSIASRKGISIEFINSEFPREEDSRSHLNISYHQHVMDIMSEKSLETGRILFRKALENPLKPSAIIYITESSAIGGISEALSRGVGIPDDIAVVCLNRSLVTPMSPIPLTTVCAGNEVIARNMLGFMIDHIEGRTASGSSMALDPVLVQGGTT